MSNFHKWFKCRDGYNLKDKSKGVRFYVQTMLSRTQSMFKYDGLPDSIPQRMLELYLQTNGNVCIADYEGTLYAFTGGLGGEQDVYYRPTLYTVANPALKLSKAYKIDTDCVIIPSDSMYMGLMPMFQRYATMIVENDISLLLADQNLRITALISAEDQRTANAAKVYIDQIAEGHNGIIAESTFIGGLKVQPYSTHSSNGVITQLIELQQYLKAGWYNDIGVQSNYNMKRESIGSDESALQYDSLLPLVDDMLTCRKEGIDKVNRMFGTNIRVSLNSVWEDRQEKVEAALDDVENAEQMTPEHQEGDNGTDTKTE